MAGSLGSKGRPGEKRKWGEGKGGLEYERRIGRGRMRVG